jgi:hypothetical protein
VGGAGRTHDVPHHGKGDGCEPYPFEEDREDREDERKEHGGGGGCRARVVCGESVWSMRKRERERGEVEDVERTDRSDLYSPSGLD